MSEALRISKFAGCSMLESQALPDSSNMTPVKWTALGNCSRIPPPRSDRYPADRNTHPNAEAEACPMALRWHGKATANLGLEQPH